MLNLKNRKICLMLREVKHTILLPKKYNRMSYALDKYKKNKNNKDSKLIRKEIKMLKDYWGCYPNHYFRYGLYNEEINISKCELKNYIPEFFFYNLFLPQTVGNDNKLLDDKINLSNIFNSLNINQPKNICYKVNNLFFNSKWEKIDENEAINYIYKSKAKKIFIKPADGQGGFGIYIFTLKDGKYIDKNLNKLNEEFILSLNSNNYIIQEGLIQDENISNIYPFAVNTFRIITENNNGLTRVVCAVLRVGKDGKEIDNICQDGIIVGIDKEKGILKTVGKTEKNEEFIFHPDTNIKFQGIKIDNWEEILDFVVKAAEKLYQFQYLGWDIALTKDGPIAIETNVGFGLDLLQLVLGGLKNDFNINNVNKYWKR